MLNRKAPAHWAAFLDSSGISVHLARVYSGERLPENIDGLQAIISMGGPMNVYEESEYPFLRDETILLRKAIAAGLPVLGICLGAQMIAKASGSASSQIPQRRNRLGQDFPDRSGSKRFVIQRGTRDSGRASMAWRHV